MTVPSRHSGMFLARITFFLPHVMLGLREKRDRRQEPVSPHFRGLSSLSVMPDSLDVILSLTQNHGFLRSGSRVGARDDSPFTSFWHVPSQNHVLPPSRHAQSSRKTGQTSGARQSPFSRSFLPFRHAGPRSGISVLRKSEKSEIPYRIITG